MSIELSEQEQLRRQSLAALRELGIDDAHFDIMAEKAANGGLAHGFEPLAKEDVLKIFRMAL